MSGKAVGRNDYKIYFHMFVSFIFMFFFRYLPTFSTVTLEGMQILGVFIGVVYGWLFVGMLWTSLLTFLALSMTSVITIGEIFVRGFGNNVFMMVFFMWILSAALSEARISDILAAKLMSLKISDKKPWIFFAVLMLSSWLCSIFLGGIIPIILFSPIIAKVSLQFGYKPYEKTPMFMFFGVLLASCLGQMCLPIQGTALSLYAIYQAMDQTFSIDFGTYLLFSIPFTLLLCISFWLLSRFVFRVDLSKMAEISGNMFEGGETTLNRRQKAILFIFVGVLVCLIVPNFLPAGIFKTFLAKIGTCGPAFIAFVLMMMIKIEGQPLMDFRKAVNCVSWDVLLVVASSLPLLSLLTSEISGVVPMIQSVFMPIMGQLSPIWFGIVTILLVVVMTNFCSNYAAAIVGFTLVVVFSGTMGFAKEPLVFTILICSHLAFATPAASVFAQIVFGNTEWIDPKQFITYTSLMLIPLGIIAAVCGILYGNLVF